MLERFKIAVCNSPRSFDPCAIVGSHFWRIIIFLSLLISIRPTVKTSLFGEFPNLWIFDDAMIILMAKEKELTQKERIKRIYGIHKSEE